MGKKKSKIKSSCCKAPIRYSDLAPDFIGDDPKTMRMGTCYIICTKCNQPCDMHISIRRTWTRNPSEQIIGDKRDKINKKVTKKEIEEIGCA